MQPTTRKLAARVQQALLALSDEMLFKMLSHWLDALAVLYEADLEILANYRECLGFRVTSGASGQIYDSLADLDEAEPEAEEIRWIPADPAHLREVIRCMQPKTIYHSVIALAGEAFQQADFADQWAKPPGEYSDGYGFMKSLERYLSLRKEAKSDGIEQFEARYAEQLAACADAFPDERAQAFWSRPELSPNERSVHFCVTLSTADEQQQTVLRQALRQYDCTFSPSVNTNSLECSVYYTPGRRNSLKTLVRVRRVLSRWQRAGWITWTEHKEKPPKRQPRTKHKQKTGRQR